MWGNGGVMRVGGKKGGGAAGDDVRGAMILGVAQRGDI